jgi:hypothetical protein
MLLPRARDAHDPEDRVLLRARWRQTDGYYTPPCQNSTIWHHVNSCLNTGFCLQAEAGTGCFFREHVSLTIRRIESCCARDGAKSTTPAPAPPPAPAPAPAPGLLSGKDDEDEDDDDDDDNDDDG